MFHNFSFLKVNSSLLRSIVREVKFCCVLIITFRSDVLIKRCTVPTRIIIPTGHLLNERMAFEYGKQKIPDTNLCED